MGNGEIVGTVISWETKKFFLNTSHIFLYIQNDEGKILIIRYIEGGPFFSLPGFQKLLSILKEGDRVKVNVVGTYRVEKATYDGTGVISKIHDLNKKY